jgi:RHS repeat-associated protein
VQATTGTNIVRYVYLPGTFLVLATLDAANNLLETFTHGPDLSGTLGGAGGIGGILSQTKHQGPTTTHVLHPDSMGNMVMTTDGSGAISSAYRYTPFGRLYAKTGPFTSRFTFSSKECDASTGLGYYGFRYYSPQTGRWMSRDRIGERGGINLYAFGPNSPVNGFDTLGDKWRNADAVKHFYTGEGRDVTIDGIGLRSEITSAAQPRMDEFEQMARDDSVAVGMKIDCAVASPRWKTDHIQKTDSVGVNSGIFWIGGFSLARQYDCRIEVDCGKCTGEYKCDLLYFMDDEFRDPLDFDNSGGADFWDHWQVGGTPFFVRGHWEKQIDGKFNK